jgi:rhamnulokinase
MSIEHFVACDLGAESGRVILASLSGGKLQLEEVHRFANGPVRVLGTLRWDVLRIFDELKRGLAIIGRRGIRPRSLSVDSWGVDYVWLRGGGPQLSAPFHYRDARNDAAFERVTSTIGRESIFRETGVQFMALNTLYQLAADRAADPALLEAADGFLNIGDYFNYLFSGVARAEQSLASTTQIYDPRSHQWSKPLQEALGLPARLFPEIVPSGTVLGPLLPDIAAETGLEGCSVVATCSHDTGAAVAAVPANSGSRWAYLSSGTWSLLGVELDAPCIDDDVLAANFTNEVGHGGSIRFLKNIVGLWILQECRRTWEITDGALTYDDLARLAAQAPAFRSLINPNAARFLKPGGMPEKIAAYCRETGQPEPRGRAEIVRCVLDSLALLYAASLDEIEALTRRTIRTLHIVGGGSRNLLLNQITADATGRTVLAGPAEATAIGNALLQAVAAGLLPSLEALRTTVRDSFPVVGFEPVNSSEVRSVRRFYATLDLAT